MRKIVFLGIVLASLAGCSDLPEASAGRIGCSPNDIKISDEHGGPNKSKTWIATCNGKRYVCSEVKTGKDMSDISCAPEQK
jgi:hypothetical protein